VIWQVMNEFSQEELLLNMGSSKDKHGVCERFAKEQFFIREEWPFPDKGILTNNDIPYLYYLL